MTALTGTVGDLVGVEIVPSGGDTAAFNALAALALRDNPRRAHLIVSKVLAKHIPVAPRKVLEIGYQLGDAVADLLHRPGTGALVIGYCETATGLGHAVADRLDMTYLHTTRRAHPTLPVEAQFDEEHSHAVAHLVQPAPGISLRGDGPLVLVDDELTTGRTALNTIEALHARFRRRTYVIAVIIDARSPEARATFEARVAALGVDVRVAALHAIQILVPADAIERAVVARPLLVPGASPPEGPLADVRVHHGWWPPGVPVTARHGMDRDETAKLVAEAATIAERLSIEMAALPPSASVLVLGTEELVYLPTHVAAELATRLPDAVVVAQSTTRSPVYASDDPRYGVRRTSSFAAPDDPSRQAHVHNLMDPAAVPPAGSSWAQMRHDHIVVVVDAPAEACRPLVEALKPYAGVVHLVPVGLPVARRSAQPGAFGSYEAEDVTWLLTDLSDLPLERGTEDREEAIQAGFHYSEMLPIEYEPSDQYVALFHRALRASADRLAISVGIVGELIWDAHGSDEQPPVLVSLARAGTPVGILLRRYYARTRRVSASHYTISIIRGRGIDQVALATILARHPAESVAFVDGWTGKGAIQRQLTEAVALWKVDHPEHDALDDRLAVLADPGFCTPLHGTRDDFLIPSACLNSTVSGLVSRTVYRTDLIGSGMYHGAKYYAAWHEADLSRFYVDTIAARFAKVGPAIAAGHVGHGVDRTPTWEQWAALVSIAREHGITDINLVKPGVGETTRVLLRRVPWRVLVRPDRVDDLAHVLMLAEARNVAVVEVPDLTYSCVGLIRQVR